MASSYNFDEAYSADSFTDSDWEKICDHVGLNFGSDEEERSVKKIEQKTEDEHERSNAQEGKGKEFEEKGNESEKSETDFVTGLRKDMKNLRKNLKKGRVQLLNLDENDTEGIEETYKEFKHSTKRIKKKFKELLYGTKDDKVGIEGEKNKRENISVDAMSKSVKSSLTSTKPVCMFYQGQPQYKCPSCDFIGHSMGRAYSHMVNEHNAKPLGCKKCPFTMKNPTSLHNHNKLYCPKKDK